MTISTVRGKIRREPQRFVRLASRVAYASGAVVSRGVLDAVEGEVLALAEIAEDLCRFNFGAGAGFRFCAAPATVRVAGALTYCTECWSLTKDQTVRRDPTDTDKRILHKYCYRPSRILCDPISIDLALSGIDESGAQK